MLHCPQYLQGEAMPRTRRGRRTSTAVLVALHELGPMRYLSCAGVHILSHSIGEEDLSSSCWYSRFDAANL
jgi:hypothetical protein